MVREAEGRDKGAPGLGGALELIESSLSESTVMADTLDVEQTSMAWKPILRSAGRFLRRLPMPKSRVLLMVVSVRNARPSL